MKTRFIILFMISFLICCNVGFCNEKNENKNGELLAKAATQTLQIVSSPELNDLATSWLAGYGLLHPEQEIVLSCQSEVTPLKEGNLYLLSNNQAWERDKQVWKMVIGHDLVVPVINTKNPLYGEITKKGVTSDDLAKLISEGANWSMVIDGSPTVPVKCYITDNQKVTTKIAGFTKKDQSATGATIVTTAAELISLVQKDVNAIGFCKLTDALNKENNEFAAQIGIVPIDKNRNGRIDSFENIYTNPLTLTRGAWIGKYPRELCGDIYAISASKPINQPALDFMTYITGVGQDYIKASGYSILSSTERKANMLLLSSPVTPSDSDKKAPFIPLSWLLSLGAIILIMLFAVLYNLKRTKRPAIEGEDIETTPALNENSILAPRGLFYDKTHTWAFMEQDGMVKIGIDDFIKHVTGPITQLKMKSPGEKVRKGEKILTVIRDGKQLNLHSPVSGFIRKQNESLLASPAKINTTQFTDAWVYQIEPANWLREVNFMFMFDKYREWLEDEFSRLKDFLAASANSNTVVYQHVVLQDGGELKDNVLSDLGPEVWEDFQTRFIDTSK